MDTTADVIRGGWDAFVDEVSFGLGSRITALRRMAHQDVSYEAALRAAEAEAASFARLNPGADGQIRTPSWLARDIALFVLTRRALGPTRGLWAARGKDAAAGIPATLLGANQHGAHPGMDLALGVAIDLVTPGPTPAAARATPGLDPRVHVVDPEMLARLVAERERRRRLGRQSGAPDPHATASPTAPPRGRPMRPEAEVEGGLRAMGAKIDPSGALNPDGTPKLTWKTGPDVLAEIKDQTIREMDDVAFLKSLGWTPEMKPMAIVEWIEQITRTANGTIHPQAGDRLRKIMAGGSRTTRRIKRRIGTRVRNDRLAGEDGGIT
ncbi:MAG: hypothetical protein AAF909_10960 [Pseudomonadota bacterium]